MEDLIISEFFESVLESEIEKELMRCVIKDLPEDEIVEKMLEYYIQNKKKLEKLGEDK